MTIYTTIIVEFLLVSICILLLFRLRSKLGLAPLYILLGSIQYLQANLGGIVSFEFFDSYAIYPGSVILFSAVLFAVLLIYIKEGATSARALIIGIIISNLIITGLFDITHAQELIIRKAQNIDINTISVFKINYKFFVVGTLILLLDFFLLVIIYQFLVSKIKKNYFFFVLFISLFTVLMFDSIVFNVSLLYNSAGFKSSLLGHFAGKSVATIIFSIILFVYLKYGEKETIKSTFIANQQRDIFSILSYREKIKHLETEKKEVEKKLTSQLETTLNNISDGFVSLDTNWCYTYINKKAAEFLGKLPESLIGKNIWTEFPEGVNHPFYKAYHEAVNTQKTIYFEDYYKPFDRWFENRIYPSSEGLAIYFTDVTEQKKAELALIKSEKYLENIINNIGDTVFVKDDKSKFLLVNDAFNNIFNLSKTDVLGKTLAENLPPEEMEVFLSNDKEVLSTGIENINEETISVQGKESIIVSTKKTRYIDDSGNKFLIGVFRDITERKKAEKVIIESEEKFSKAFESKVIGKAILNKEKQIVEINEALTNIVGFKRENMLGKTAEEIGLFNFDDEKNLENENILWSEFSKNGYASNIELKYLMQDGKELFILISLQALQLNNEDHVLITILDITEKKNVEAELEHHRNNLEELVKTRTEEVNTKNNELNRMNKLFVGRELKMKELKNIIKELQLKK